MKKLVSGIVLTLLLTSMLALAFNIQLVKANGTIYIRADGSIDPPDAPISTVDNVTYTLTGNITSVAYGIAVERSNIIIDGAGYTVEGTGVVDSEGISLSELTNVTIKNTNITRFYYCIGFFRVSSSNIQGNNITNNGYGIYLERSSNNSISGNNVTSKWGDCISLSHSSNNTISGNNLTDNDRGIMLSYSSNNTISENNITNNNWGVELEYSSGNSVSGNNIANNGYGIYLIESSNNTISGNNITANNNYGIYLYYLYSSDNIIYHNNFIDNVYDQVYSGVSVNVWDDGFPSGGNYWSDYTGIDANGDGIGDTPYVIDVNNQDRYPLMHPWSPLPVHNINTGLGYATIQEAISANEALNGHTIFVEEGTYYENVVMNKSLTLIGENPETTIVDGSGIGDGIHVIANNVMINGFTFQNGYGGISLSYSSGDTITNNRITLNSLSGIEHYHSNDNIIHDNKVTLNSHGGIWLVNSSNNAVTYNTVSNNSWQGILLEDFCDNNIVSNNVVTENSDGIRLGYSTDNLVSYNNATLNVDCGIQLVYSENSNVKKNVVTLNSIGIMLHASEHNVIEDNKVTHNGEGILLAFSNRNIVEANEAVENGGNGIRLYNSSYNEVSHNNASIDDTGIVLETSSNNNTLVGNNVASNYNGILVGYSSNNNTIYHNNFLHNTVQVAHITSGCVNVWDNGYPSGGNYWSDYNGTDLYSGPCQNETGSDGMGDTPYVIDADNQDRYPLMRPWNSFVLYGDVNGDGTVNILDVILMSKAFGTSQGDLNYDPSSDLNQDGRINILDMILVAKHFGQHIP